MDFLRQQFEKQFDKILLLGAMFFCSLILLHLHRDTTSPAIHDLIQFFITLTGGFQGALLRALMGPERAQAHPPAPTEQPAAGGH